MRSESQRSASETDRPGGYDPQHFAVLAAVEEAHFWFLARNRVISNLVASAVADLPPGYRALEIGCGNGNVLRHLEKTCRDGIVIGMDLFAEGLQFARMRTHCSLVQGNASLAPFSTTFQLIGMFDVLEHVRDDVGMLRDTRSLLDPEGTLLLTVPAHPSLWSYFDEAAHHCRRYERQELVSKLEDTGYEIEYLTEYMASIYPLVWIGRHLANWRRGNRNAKELVYRELQIYPLLNRALTALLFQEARWISQRRHLPFGVSLIAMVKKSRD
jgi:SAM-dependent methyltransferase